MNKNFGGSGDIRRIGKLNPGWVHLLINIGWFTPVATVNNKAVFDLNQIAEKFEQTKSGKLKASAQLIREYLAAA
jgi:hypothetical protein